MYVLKNDATLTRINSCIRALVKTIMARKIKNLSLSGIILQNLIHYALDDDPWTNLFLIFFFITEKQNYFYANHILYIRSILKN